MIIEARRSSKVDEFFGVRVPDPYDWLEDAKSEETKRWRAAQAALTERTLADLPDRQRFKEIVARTPMSLEALPIERGPMKFSFGVSQNGGATLLCDFAHGSRVVFDPARDEAVRTFRLHHSFIYPSPSGRYVAVGLAAPGSDWLRVRVFDAQQGALLPQEWIETVHPVVDWLPDESGFFYNTSRARFTKSDVPDGVYRHRLGKPTSEDVLAFEHEPGVPGHASLPIVAGNGSRLLVKTIDFVTQKSTLHLLPVDAASAKPRELLAAEQKFNLVGEMGDEILLETDLGAPRGRIVAIDISAPAVKVRDVVAQRDETLEISTHSTRSAYTALCAGRIYATYVKDVANRVLMFSSEGMHLGDAAIDGLFTVQRVQAQKDGVIVSVTRFNLPCERHRLDTNGSRIDSAALETQGWTAPPIDAEQIFCYSDDGTRIPMFVIRPRGARGPLPTILYGYGGWGSSLTPCYRPDLAAWIERGGAYAIVNTRGGGEYGEAWHEAGARLNRIKTFEDYCAAARELIARGICHSDGLAARGASNGGLLVSACANRCPELFAAVSAGVPLVDVVNLIKLPAGAAISQEIGDPTASQAAFEYMHSYSPLQNVRANERRPAMLLWPGEVDDRVSASQAYKHVAALQATAKPGQVALLRVIEGEGHMSWPESTQREMLVDELAFLWSHVAKPGEKADAA